MSERPGAQAAERAARQQWTTLALATFTVVAVVVSAVLVVGIATRHDKTTTAGTAPPSTRSAAPAHSPPLGIPYPSPVAAQHPKVILWGDSIVPFAVYASVGKAAGYDVVNRSVVGLTWCSSFGTPHAYWQDMEDSIRTRPSAVVIQFAGGGSDFETCGPVDVPPTGKVVGGTVFRAWLTWLRGIVKLYSPHTRLIVVGSPGSDVSWFAENFRKLDKGAAGAAASFPGEITFLPVAKYLAVGGHYPQFLPCLPQEISLRHCGPQVDPSWPAGQNKARGDDRAHLCPKDGPAFVCLVWATSQYRMALVLVNWMNDWFRVHPLA